MPGRLSHPSKTHRASWLSVLVIGTAFLALMGAALLSQRHVGAAVPVTDKQARAPETTGRSFVPIADGRMCRELVFDRVTSEIVESRTRACWLPEISDEPDMVTAPVPTNNRSRNGFRWGKTTGG